MEKHEFLQFYGETEEFLHSDGETTEFYRWWSEEEELGFTRKKKSLAATLARLNWEFK